MVTHLAAEADTCLEVRADTVVADTASAVVVVDTVLEDKDMEDNPKAMDKDTAFKNTSTVQTEVATSRVDSVVMVEMVDNSISILLRVSCKVTKMLAMDSAVDSHQAVDLMLLLCTVMVDFSQASDTAKDKGILMQAQLI